MGRLGDGVKNFNSTVRTILAAVFVGIVGWLGYFGYSEYTANERVLKEQQEQLTSLQGELEDKTNRLEDLGTEVKQKEQEIDRLETAMQLLKTDQRLARLTVTEIERGEDGEVLQTKLQFVELSPTGEALSEPKEIELPGDIVYVDNWIVKFDDQYIEKGDIERGTSLCLFHRIFSEQQMPSEGVSLDEIGMRPQAYGRGGEMSEFEKSLWADFWEFANDEEKATEMGIRAAHGEAISIKVKEGKGYNIRLRASGGLSFEPFNVVPETNESTL
ncbi:MAG: hypothetical protein AAGG44_11015 [Planctomycetota bacterium]